MKLSFQFAIVAAFGALFALLVVSLFMAIIIDNKSATSAATHYVACPGFTQPLAVWGDPIPSGPYLSVKLSADGEWRLIGPNCGIIPNPDNM